MGILDTVAQAVQSVTTIFKGGEGTYNEDLAKFVNDEFKRRQQEKRPFELQERLNLAFLEGNQYLEINPVSNNLEEVPKLYWWQEREVFNQIAPIIQTRVSKLVRQRLVMKVRPATTEQKDISTAQVSSKLLVATDHDQRITQKMSDAILWSEVSGYAGLKHVWDPRKGRVLGRMMSDDQEQEVREGDLDVIVVPASEQFPDSVWNQDIDRCRSFIHAKAFHVDEIEDIWGTKVDPEDATALNLQRTPLGLGGLGYGQGSFRVNTIKLKNHAMVKEYSERPSRKYPKGRLIVIAGDKTLYAGDLPYLTGQDFTPDIPIVKWDAVKRPGCYCGKSVIELLISVQRRYNANKNRRAEWLNRAAIGQLAIEDGSMDLDDVENDGAAPGKIFVYAKGSRPPDYVNSGDMPSAFDREEVSLLNEFSIISGVSELSRKSEAPAGVKSGVALSIAQEQDDTRLSSAQTNIETARIESAKKVLRIYRQFAKGPRMFRYVGNDNMPEVLDWNGSDIRSDDVIIESGAGLAESPSQRKQMVFDLLGAGLFNDPETGRLSKAGRAKVFELLAYGNWEDADDEEQLHMSRADRENRALMQGNPVPVMTYDDDVLHLNRHTRLRLTADYEEMVQNNPVIDQMFEAHVEMHMQRLQAIAQQEAMQGAFQYSMTAKDPATIAAHLGISQEAVPEEVAP